MKTFSAILALLFFGIFFNTHAQETLIHQNFSSFPSNANSSITSNGITVDMSGNGWSVFTSNQATLDPVDGGGTGGAYVETDNGNQPRAVLGVLPTNSELCHSIKVSWYERISVGNNNGSITRKLLYRIPGSADYSEIPAVSENTGINNPNTTFSGQGSTGWRKVSVILPANGNYKNPLELKWDITRTPGASSKFAIDEIRVTGFLSSINFLASEAPHAPISFLFLEAPLSTPALESYLVSGSNLIHPVRITASTATGPQKFKVSKTFTYTIAAYTDYVDVFPQPDGSLPPTEIWVIYLGSDVTGSVDGSLTHASGITRILPLEGFTTMDPPAPFPVELSSFLAQSSNGAVKLTWTTASEKNNEKFVVERSQDGRNFTAIGEVSGSGNSATRRSYSFTDAQPGNGTNYYRLRQVDFDGTTSFSYVVALQVAITEATVYPTVATREVRISLPDAERGRSITVTDATGRPVATFTNTTEREIKLPLENLRSGMYFVRITDGQSQQVQRFIKQ